MRTVSLTVSVALLLLACAEPTAILSPAVTDVAGIWEPREIRVTDVSSGRQIEPAARGQRPLLIIVVTDGAAGRYTLQINRTTVVDGVVRVTDGQLVFEPEEYAMPTLLAPFGPRSYAVELLPDELILAGDRVMTAREAALYGLSDPSSPGGEVRVMEVLRYHRLF